jgi:hypothetical protein
LSPLSFHISSSMSPKQFHTSIGKRAEHIFFSVVLPSCSNAWFHQFYLIHLTLLSLPHIQNLLQRKVLVLYRWNIYAILGNVEGSSKSLGIPLPCAGYLKLPLAEVCNFSYAALMPNEYPPFLTLWFLPPLLLESIGTTCSVDLVMGKNVLEWGPHNSSRKAEILPLTGLKVLTLSHPR